MCDFSLVVIGLRSWPLLCLNKYGRVKIRKVTEGVRFVVYYKQTETEKYKGGFAILRLDACSAEGCYCDNRIPGHGGSSFSPIRRRAVSTSF